MTRPRSFLGAALGLLALAACPVPAAESPRLALVGATVIDGTGAPPLADATVLIEDARIAAVGPRSALEPPAGSRVLPLAGKWIIPGLIDAHVHFFQSGGLYTRPDFIDLRAVRPYGEEIRRIRAKLDETFARYLASGVTSVVDLGGPRWTLDLPRLAAASAAAPRIAVTGPLLGTYAPAALAQEDPAVVRLDTPAAARDQVRRLAAGGADLIKVWFVHPRKDLGGQLAWVRAAVAEARAAGLRVAAHATQHRVAEAVVEAGVRVLAHGVDDWPLDDRLLGSMADRGVVYVTTLGVRPGYRAVFGRHVGLRQIERRLGDPAAIASFGDLDRLPRELVPDWVRPERPRSLDPVMAMNLRRVQARGITVAAGSDAGNIGTLHGPALHRELALMVEAGLDPMAVLVAATRGGAAAMGRSGALGTLEPGKLADLVVLDADPLADIRHTERIHLVVKDGRVFDPREIEARLKGALR